MTRDEIIKAAIDFAKDTIPPGYSAHGDPDTFAEIVAIRSIALIAEKVEEIEWEGCGCVEGEGMKACPACGAYAEDREHESDCWLAALTD